MDSSKSTIIGMVLIFAVFIGWMYWMSQEQAKAPKPASIATLDTSHTATSSKSAQPGLPTATNATPESASPTNTPPQGISQHGASARDTSSVFATRAIAPTVKTIETPYFTAQISSNGGAISSFILKKYKTWDGKQVQLVNPETEQGADIDLKFVASDGKTIATNNLPFQFDPKSLTLGPNDTVNFSAICTLDSANGTGGNGASNNSGSNRSIEKIFRVTGAGYVIGIEYQMHGLENSIGGYHYTAALDNPLPYVEKRSSDETAGAKVFAGQAGEMEDLTVSKPGARNSKSVGGDISYAGMRTEYFEKAMVPVGMKTVGAELSGFADTVFWVNGQPVPTPDGGIVAKYTPSINIPIGRTTNETLNFNLYFGPLEYDRVESLGVGLEESMYFGWAFVVRPISIHLLLPFFLWLHGFMSNWGVVIIVFSLVIKLATIPLSMGQLRSMKKMQVVQPMVMDLRTKYKDDPKKMNEEMMKIYRTYGVNPAGGCLPTLLQMPILFALYQVLKNVIELRQAPFAFWIHDLSIPDALIHFGTKIPLVGEQLSGLTLLLVVTMVIQQMFTVVSPQQKQMAYIMPVVFLFMFNNLPSGVALYYFTYNIVGLVQQFYLTKIATPPTLEELKAAPKKGGGLMGRLQQMEQQQRDTRRQQYAGKGLPSGKKK